MSSSKISKFIVFSAATLLNVDCGGPGPLSLAIPPAPEIPLLEKNSASGDCTNSTSKGKAQDRKELELAPKVKVGYREKIRAYLADNCVSCHGKDGAAPDLSTYDGAKRAAKLSLSAIREDAMPPENSSSDSDKETFAAWISGGLLETVGSSCDATKKPTKKNTGSNKQDGNGTRPTTPTDVPPPAIGPAPSPGQAPRPTPGPNPNPAPGAGGNVTYKTVIKPYLDSKCGACHGRAPVLTSYAAAKSAATESLNSMKAGRMPPGSRPGQTDINNLQAWISAGYPE